MTLGAHDIEYILVACNHPIFFLFLKITESACNSFYEEFKEDTLVENYKMSYQGTCFCHTVFVFINIFRRLGQDNIKLTKTG